MRVYLDTEFVDTGKTIDLISIGLVADDGKELYRINASGHAVGVAANQHWLSKNVVPQLPVNVHHSSLFPPEERELFEMMSASCWYTWDERHPDYQYVVDGVQLRRDVHTFLSAYKDVELWADHAAYDHVVLAQLFGRMIDLPKGIPMFTHELMQEWGRLGKPELPQQQYGVHHALHDARHNKVVGDFLKRRESQVKVDLRGSQVMSDSDMDKLVGKVGRRIASSVQPSGGVRISAGRDVSLKVEPAGKPRVAVSIQPDLKAYDLDPVSSRPVHEPPYVRQRLNDVTTSYSVAWLADETDKLIERLNTPHTCGWQYRLVGAVDWINVTEGLQSWFMKSNRLEFRRKPVDE